MAGEGEEGWPGATRMVRPGALSRVCQGRSPAADTLRTLGGSSLSLRGPGPLPCAWAPSSLGRFWCDYSAVERGHCAPWSSPIVAEAD